MDRWPAAVRVAVGMAARIDLLAALGPRRAVEHRRQVRARSRLGTARAHDVYAWIWRDAAAELGVEVAADPAGSLELSRAGRVTRVDRQVTALDDLAAVERSRDRAAVQRHLREADLPVAEYIELDPTDVRRALAFLSGADPPCVVKPAGGTGAGYGITCGVRSRSDLLRAALEACRHSPRLLLEREAPGAMYRILVLDGEVIATVRRNPPHVTGDGSSSIAELVAHENRHRLDAGGYAGLSPLRLDLDCLFTLEAAGLGLGAVPPVGERVAIKTSSSDSGPPDNEPQESIGPELAAEAVAGAAVAGLRLAGVDVVTPDPTRGLQAAGGALVEVNATPGLHHHYLVRDPGRAQRVAVTLLRRLLDDPHVPAG